MAVRASQVGQTARERTILSNAAQKQLEDLRGFRNNYPWDVFLNGLDGPSDVRGVMIAAIPSVDGHEIAPNAVAGQGCHVYQPCMHMIQLGGGVLSYTAWPRAMAGEVPTSYLEMSVVPNTPIDPQRVDVIISYGAEALGGGAPIRGHIKTTFVKMQLASAAGSVAPPVAPPAPTGCTEGDKDIVLVLDVSGSMGETWQNRGAPGYDPTVRKIDKQKAVANSFINQTLSSRPGNRIGLVFFNGAVVANQPFTNNIGTLTAAVNSRNPGGTTAYIPPLQRAQQMLTAAASGREQIVVFVSDGRPNQDGGTTASNITRQNLIWAQRATMTTSKLYSVGVDGDPLMFNILRGLSDRGKAGGFFGDAGSSGQLDAVFNDISADLACPGGVGATPPVLPPPPPTNPGVCVPAVHRIVVVLDDSSYMTGAWSQPDPMTKQFAWSLHTLNMITNAVNPNLSSQVVTLIHNSVDGVRDSMPFSHSTLGSSNLLTSGQAHGTPDWNASVTRALQLAGSGPADAIIFVAFGPGNVAQLAAGMASNPGVLSSTKVYTVGVDAGSPNDYSMLPGFSAAGKVGGFYTYAESSDDLKAAYEDITNDLRCNS